MVDTLITIGEYLVIPGSVIIGLIIVLGILQIIGGIMESCNKAVPPLLKLFKIIKDKRKAKKDKKQELQNAIEILPEVKSLLSNIKKHYDEDNISKRDKWMLEVNTTMNWAKDRAKVYDSSVKELKDLAEVVKKQSENIEKQQKAIEMNNKMTSDMYKQSCRRDILDFEHKIINARKADKPLIISREEFRKIRKTYDAYEEFLKNYGGTNGEVDDAMEVIRCAERGEYSYIEFLEDIRD